MIRNRLGPLARFLVVAAAVACWLPSRAAAVAAPVQNTITKPSAPPNLKVTPLNSTTLELTWDWLGNDIARYQVRASANGSTGWSTIATPTINLHVHSGLDPGSTWYYRVAAINTDNGEVGDYSTAQGTTPGSTGTGTGTAPRNLTAVAVGSTSITSTGTYRPRRPPEKRSAVTGWTCRRMAAATGRVSDEYDLD